jgi:glycosyltransferase involved in cell wall biosynthesis
MAATRYQWLDNRLRFRYIWRRKAAILMNKISAILITLNEEKNLEACLESVKWVDEIVVVDCGSRDRTEEIARRYGARFHTRAWEGFADQKAHALGLASHEWILSVDADERVSAELAAEIRRAVESGSADGYRLKRDNYFLGKLMTGGGWQRDYQTRLFRKSRARMTDRLVHEGFEIDGAVATIESPLLHYTYSSISTAFAKLNEYTSLEAIEYAATRKSSGGAVVAHACSSFLRSYVSRRGYRDGAHGLVLSLVNAAATALLYMKLWEIQRSGAAPAGDDHGR